MLDIMVRNWWMFAVRGALALVIGVLAFVRPDITLVALVTLIAIYAIIDGVTSFVAAFTHSGQRYMWWLLLEGVLGVGVGVLIFRSPALAIWSLVTFLGAWLFFSGIFRIIVGIELRKKIDNEWYYVVGGVLSIIAGALTFLHPLSSSFAWVWVFGIYAIFFGLIQFALGFKLRGRIDRRVSTDTVAHT